LRHFLLLRKLYKRGGGKVRRRATYSGMGRNNVNAFNTNRITDLFEEDTKR